MSKTGQTQEFDPNPADFQSIRLKFEITNTTTSQDFRKDQAEIKMVELGERGMTLEVPWKSCAQGHSLIIVMTTAGIKSGDFVFETTAKVSEYEQLEDGIDRVVVSFVQFDEKVWEKFLKSFSDRQREIEQFFAATRGFG